MKYLSHETVVKIRFSEVDSLGIVWHGNYLKFFEDGREAFGEKYGMSYLELYKHKLITPIVKSSMEYKMPLKFGDVVKIETRYIYTKAAKIVYHYNVYEQRSGKLAATGMTEQVFVSEKMELQLNTPEVFENWKNQLDWKEA